MIFFIIYIVIAFITFWWLTNRSAKEMSQEKVTHKSLGEAIASIFLSSIVWPLTLFVMFFASLIKYHRDASSQEEDGKK